MQLKMVDLSKWQGHVNWNVLKEAPLHGVFIRASQGLVADPEFSFNLEGARLVGLRPGAYHFFRPEVDLQAQAQFFFDRHPPLMRTDLPPAIDVEFSQRDGLDEWLASGSAYHREMLIKDFMGMVQDLFKVEPVIYTSAAFVSQYLPPNHGLGKYRLWAAHYPQREVLPLSALPVWKPAYLPAGWADYWMWQYGQVNLPGVGVVDGDVMNENQKPTS